MGLESNLRVLSKQDLERVHEATIEVLENTGIGFKSAEAREIFQQHGARVDGEIVYISREMLEKALESTPSSFKWLAKNEERSIIVGGVQDRVHISPNNGPVYIQDIENGRRLGTMDDLVNLYKLCQASDIVNVVGAIPVEPSELDPKSRHLEVFYQLLRHVDKPLIGFAANKHQLCEMFDMLEISLGGKGSLSKGAYIGVSVNPLSPLQYDDVPCETIIEYAKRGQIVFALTCALSGVSAPINLLGTAVLQNAELLAGLVLTQLVNPGNPFLYSPASTVANMQKASYITGSPEANLINIIGLQMAREIYNIPCRAMAGLTDAKTVDCQSGYETMQNLMMLMLGGVHIINECLGVLDSIMITSYEKFILDEEMMSRVLRIMQGVDVSDKALSVDVIKEVGQNGSYLLHDSTYEHFRDRWTPSISDWGSYDDWKNDGSMDVVKKANKRYKEILAKAPESLLDTKLENELTAYIQQCKY